MIKSILKLTAILFLTISSLFSQTIDLKSGYQLKGAIDNIDPKMFNNSCAKYIFKFDTTTQSWKAYVADGEDYGYEGENITSLNRTDGFWAMGGENPCSIKINDKQDTVLPDGTPYIITSDKLDIVENETEVIMLLSKGSTSAVTYSLAGGSEHRFFTIDSASGLLTFKEKPNYENPQDLGLDNTYEVKVSVSDGDLKSEKTLNINIIDNINENFEFVGEPYTYNLDLREYKYCPITQYGEGVISYEGNVTEINGTIVTTSMSSGCIKFKKTYEERDFIVNIKVTDANNNTIYKTFTVTNGNTVRPTLTDFTFESRSNELKEVPLSGTVVGDYNIGFRVKVQPEHGTMIQKDDGSWWYRSDFNYIGSDSFVYEGTIGSIGNVKDAITGLWTKIYNYYNEGVVTINVVNSNHKPEIESQTLTTQEEQPLTIKLSAYDYEQDNITYSIILDSIKNGTVTKVDNSTYTYTPNKDFFGDENITYTANDGTSISYEAQLNIKVTNINDAPTIEETFHTIEPKPMTENTTVLYDYETMKVSVQSTAYDVEDDTLVFMVVSEPKNGKVKVYKNGGYVYVPNFGYSGEDSFAYKAYDGQNYSNIATITIDIKPIDMKSKRILLSTGATVDHKKMAGDDGDTRRGIVKTYTRDDEGFVIDHASGLMWMDNGDNLVDKVTTHKVAQYTNQEPKPDSIHYDIKQVTYEEAENYCSTLSLGGYNDWRIPKRLETYTLMDRRASNSLSMDMDIGEVPRTVGEALKYQKFKYAAPSMTVFSGVKPRSFYIDIKNKDGNREFDFNGEDGYYGGKLGYSSTYVAPTHGFMCVRGTWTMEPVMFEDPTNKIILDTTTNTMWHKTIELTSAKSQLQLRSVERLEKRWAVPFNGTPEEEIAYCENMEVGGFTDWVLPNYMEAKSRDSNEKYLADMIHAPSDDNLTFDRMMSAVRVSHGVLKTAQIGDIRETNEKVPFDENKYFSFDGNKTFVSRDRPPIPWYTDKSFEFVEKDSDGNYVIKDEDDFIFNGINYKECLPLRDNDELFLWELLRVKVANEQTKGCLEDYAKSCVFDNVGSSGYDSCEWRKPDEFTINETVVKESYTSGSVSVGSLATVDNSLGVRCKRDATDTEATNFFERFALGELEKKPTQDEFSFDKEKNSFTNTRTKHTHTRVVDNGDDTLTDNMTGIMIPKYMYYVGGIDTNEIGDQKRHTYEEAKAYVKSLNDGNYLGYNDWTLPDEQDIEFFQNIYSGGTEGFLHTHIQSEDDKPMWGLDSWFLRESEDDENSAYMLKHTDLKTAKYRVMIVRANRIDANIKSVNSVKGLEILTLDATNSYLGYSGNESKITYKWEYLKRNISWLKASDISTPHYSPVVEIVPNLTIVDANKAVATVVMPDVNNSIELRFKLTMKLEGDDTEYVDILQVYLDSSKIDEPKIIKIDANGAELDANATVWSCVKDLSTGLVWEKMSNDPNDSKYRDKLMTYDDALSMKGFKCGVNLRLPTSDEFRDTKNKYELVYLSDVLYSKRDGFNALLNYASDTYWVSYELDPLLDRDGWISSYSGIEYKDAFDKSQQYDPNSIVDGQVPNEGRRYIGKQGPIKKDNLNRVWLVGEGN